MHTTTTALLAAIALTTPAFAQDDAQPNDVTTEQASKYRIAFSASETINFDTDIDDAPGDVFTARTDLGLSISGNLKEDFSISLALSGTFSQYDFSGTADPLLTGPEALEDAYELGVRLSGRHTIDETWSVVGGLFTRAGFAESADLDDAFTFGGFLAAGYKHSESFSIDFGVLATSRLEDDALVVPYIALIWSIDDTLTLTTTGLGARLDAKIDDDWTVFLRGRYDTHEYRLDDAFAALPGGVVRDESFPIGVGIRYAPSREFSITLEGGVVLAREFEFFDNNENEIRTIETDSGAFLGIRVAFSF